MGELTDVQKKSLPLKPIEKRLPIVNPIQIPYYEGINRVFILNERQIKISSEMDAFNFYRNVFTKIVSQALSFFRNQYEHEITTLDQFMIDFPALYVSYRRPIIEAAVGILTQAGIYDISLEVFEERHMKEYCHCNEIYSSVVNEFNLTLQRNQENTMRSFDMLPIMVFSGIGGVIAATAMNISVNAMAESAIKNAKVYGSQRKKIFEQIDTNVLMDAVFNDYWNVLLTMCKYMEQYKVRTWYPNETLLAKTNAMFSNLAEGRIPEEKRLDVLVDILQTAPFHKDYLRYLYQNYLGIGETSIMLKYLNY